MQGPWVGADDWAAGRCDNRLELGRSVLISEPYLWGILLEEQLGCVDWVVRQGPHGDRLWTHLHGEVWGDLTSREIALVAERWLWAVSNVHSSGESNPAASHPVRVTGLPLGAFQRYHRGQAGGLFQGRLAGVDASDVLVDSLRQAALTPASDFFLPGAPRPKGY